MKTKFSIQNILATSLYGHLSSRSKHRRLSAKSR